MIPPHLPFPLVVNQHADLLGEDDVELILNDICINDNQEARTILLDKTEAEVGPLAGTNPLLPSYPLAAAPPA